MSVSALDEQAIREKLLAGLPKEIEHHIKVKIIFDYVTTHPVTGEEVPITPEVRQIARS